MMMCPNLDGDSGWRWLTVIITLPVIITTMLSFFVLKESPRLYARKGQHKEAVEILNYIAQYCGK